jgi:hypothetical protein
MLGTQLHVWIVFAVSTAAALVIGLGVFHRKNHTIGLREAYLCFSADLSVVPRAGQIAAQGFVLGGAWRSPDARHFRCGGSGIAAVVSRVCSFS